MVGKTVLVTGATSGIGLHTAFALAAQGADLILAARDPDKGAEARREVQALVPGAVVDMVHGDLSLMHQVDAVADQVRDRVDRLDVLVNNAGFLNPKRVVTGEGLESMFAVNHLAMFRLTDRLRPLLEGTPSARIVNVASAAHRRGMVDLDDLQSEDRFSGWGTYSTTKLMNVLFTYALARRLPEGGTTANCLHPGVVASGFSRHMPTLMRIGFDAAAVNNEKGAETPIYLASNTDLVGTSGKYFVRCRPQRSSRASYDEALQEGLWERSIEVLEGVG